MPEHVHLLVNEPARCLLSKAIQALKLSVALRSSQRPFWQAHYYDFNLFSHEKYVEKLRCMHRNLEAAPGKNCVPAIGNGPASVISHRESEEPWRLSLNGQRIDAEINCRSGCAIAGLSPQSPKARDRGRPPLCNVR